MVKPSGVGMPRADEIIEKATRIRELRQSIRKLREAKKSGRAAVGLIPDTNDRIFNQEFWTVEDVPAIQSLINQRLTQLIAELQAINDTPLN